MTVNCAKTFAHSISQLLCHRLKCQWNFFFDAIILFICVCVCARARHNFWCFLLVFSHTDNVYFVLHLNLSAIKRLCILIFVCLQFIFPFSFLLLNDDDDGDGICTVSVFPSPSFPPFGAVTVWLNCVKHHGWMITGVVCCQLPLPLFAPSSRHTWNRINNIA